MLLLLTRLRGLSGIQEAQPLSCVLTLIPALWLMLRSQIKVFDLGSV